MDITKKWLHYNQVLLYMYSHTRESFSFYIKNKHLFIVPMQGIALFLHFLSNNLIALLQHKLCILYIAPSHHATYLSFLNNKCSLYSNFTDLSNQSNI